MTKKEVVKAIATKSGITQEKANLALNALLEIVTDVLVQGDSITFPGFGTFSVAYRKPRKGVNPQTKQKIDIPGGNYAKFKAGKNLKEKVKSTT